MYEKIYPSKIVQEPNTGYALGFIHKNSNNNLEHPLTVIIPILQRIFFFPKTWCDHWYFLLSFFVKI